MSTLPIVYSAVLPSSPLLFLNQFKTENLCKSVSGHRPAKHPTHSQAVYRTVNCAFKIQQDEYEDFEISVCRVLISPTFQSSSHLEHHCRDHFKTGGTLENTERWQCVCKRGSWMGSAAVIGSFGKGQEWVKSWASI